MTGRVLVLANRGRPIPALDRDYPDIAVLEVAGLDGHPCVGIDTEWPAHEDSFQVFGYPQEGGAVQLTPGGVALLLRGLREAGAPEQAAALTSRLPGAGMFGLFLEQQQDGQDRFRFGREADGSPSGPWSWNDLD